MTTAQVSALHVYPVKSLRATGVREAAVEPWGLAGDRRWMLVDADTGKVVTQREQPRLALVSAVYARRGDEPAAAGAPHGPTGGGHPAGVDPADGRAADGGLRLSAPGCEPLDVAVPPPGPLRTVLLFGKKIDLLPAGAAADRWLSAWLDAPVRLMHLDEPAVRRAIEPGFALPGETVSLADGYPLLVTTTGSLDALNTLIAAGDRAHEGPLPMDRFRPNVVIDGTPAWAEDGWRRVRIGEVVFRVPKPCARCVVTTTDQRTAARGAEPLRTLARHRNVGSQLLFGQNLIPEHSGTLRVGDALSLVE
jgi:uncharacterized protein YcbX